MTEMQNYQMIFERIEAKYILNRKQHQQLMKSLAGHIQENQFPHSDITSVYFDSSDCILARKSLEKPAYREKLRLRCYTVPTRESEVFFEIKKKYLGVTYKRRQGLSYGEATDYILFNRIPSDSQIMKEVDYLKNSKYQLEPKALISYKRDSWDAINEPDLRITFDRDIRFNLKNLLLISPVNEHRLGNDDLIIMEIKTINAMPLWLTEILDEMKLYPGNYSKYGNIYQNYIMKGDSKCLNSYSHQYIQNSISHPILSAQQPAY